MAQETAIEYVKGDKHATFYSGESKYISMIHRLAEEYPEQVEIKSEDEGGVLAHIPVSWFRAPKPPIKRQFTEEQKQASAERMRKAREAKKLN